MSRGGRGGKVSGITMLANALGIQRGDFSAKPSREGIQPPPLFPTLDVKPLPLVSSSDYDYMVESKQEFLRRMRESPYYLKEKPNKNAIYRYSDKYRKGCVETWTPNWQRLPKILWPKSMQDSAGKSSKRAKFDKNADTKLKDTLSVLEEKEKLSATKSDEIKEKPIKDKSKNEEDENAEKNEDEPELSDEDYLEEENDYIQNYFDNGEEYLDESDDNIDGGEATY